MDDAGPAVGQPWDSSGAEPDCCVAPPAPERRPGPTRRVPESAFRVVWARRSGWRLDPRRRRQWRLGSWTAAVAARVLDQRWSRRAGDGSLAPARRSAALGPRDTTSSGLFIPRVLQVAGLAHAARRRRPKGIHPLLLLPVSRQLGTRHWTPARLRLGPAQPVSLSQLDIRVTGPGVLPGAAAAGNETPGTSQAPARISFGRTRKRGAGTRRWNNGD